MITVQTNTAKPIYNDRFKLIGNHVIYLTIQNLEMDANNVTASGYYYYINEVSTLDENNETVIMNEVVKLQDTKTFMTWETIMSIETILNPIDVLSLKDAILQRVQEFTILKLTQESGENFGTTIEDWE
jgi:hypothetical protein